MTQLNEIGKYEKVAEWVKQWMYSDEYEIKESINGWDKRNIKDLEQDIADYNKLQELKKNKLDSLCSFVLDRLNKEEEVNWEADKFEIEDIVEKDDGWMNNIIREFIYEQEMPNYRYDFNEKKLIVDDEKTVKDVMIDLGIKIDDLINKYGDEFVRKGVAGLSGAIEISRGSEWKSVVEKTAATYAAFNYKSIKGKINEFLTKHDNKLTRFLTADVGDWLKAVKVGKKYENPLFSKNKETERKYKEICQSLEMDYIDFTGNCSVFWDDELNKATMVVTDPFGDSITERFDSFESMFYCHFSDIIRQSIKEIGIEDTFTGELLEEYDFEFLDKHGFFEDEGYLEDFKIEKEYRKFKNELAVNNKKNYASPKRDAVEETKKIKSEKPQVNVEKKVQK